MQQPFRKIFAFNGLVVGAVALIAYWPMRALPDFKARPAVVVRMQFEAVEVAVAAPPFRLAGAWTMQVPDPRFHGISALAIDQGCFLAATDLGAVIRFDMPAASHPSARLQDLRFGPGMFGPKWARDAESIARDPAGRGWWIGFEQNHSLWLYDSSFRRARASVDLKRPDWWNNRGAEGLIPEGAGLLVLAENGREAMPVQSNRVGRVSLAAGAGVADAARAPDGSAWLLLRSKGLNGISQAIARLNRTQAGYQAGPAWPVPKGLFDNYEGMAIERRPGGGLRFWLVTDDGHRVMARNLLVALDYLPSEDGKSPATSAGP